MTQLLEETADRLFTEHCPPQVVAEAEGGWASAVWERMVDIGLSTAGVPEAVGGSGASLRDAATLVRVAAGHAAPVPLAETVILAGWACSVASLPFPAGPLTAVAERQPGWLRAHRSGGGWVVAGSAHRVPWARMAVRIAAIAQTDDEGEILVLLDPARCSVTPGANLAGEPRDEVGVANLLVAAEEVAPVPTGTGRQLWHRGALARTLQISGALESVLDLSVRHAVDRVQFGRPIAAFQAVQQQVALLAGEVAAASAAAQAAVAAVEQGGGELAVAAAKVRASAAAGLAARYAHQVHGAIGFSREHRLQHLTRRLWSWREEFGADEYWALELGRALASLGPVQLWSGVSDRI